MSARDPLDELRDLVRLQDRYAADGGALGRSMSTDEALNKAHLSIRLVDLHLKHGAQAEVPISDPVGQLLAAAAYLVRLARELASSEASA